MTRPPRVTARPELGQGHIPRRPARNAPVHHGPFRHYLEMVAAMIVGMIALDPVWSSAAQATGLSAWLDLPGVGELVMVVDMTLAMAVWMRFRRHSRISTAVMSAAMAAPALILLPAVWRGAMTEHVFMAVSHVLMLVAMAAVVAFQQRRADRPGVVPGGLSSLRPPPARSPYRGRGVGS